jgi:hypothetical protein
MLHEMTMPCIVVSNGFIADYFLNVSTIGHLTLLTFFFSVIFLGAHLATSLLHHIGLTDSDARPYTPLCINSAATIPLAVP